MEMQTQRSTTDKLPPSGIYKINPKMYNEMIQVIGKKGYKQREIKRQPQGRFRLKWFCNLYFCSESPIKNAMKSLADVDDIERNKTSRHILIFYQDETPEDGVEAKKIKNVFAKCIGHAQNVIKEYVDQEFSFDIGKRQVDMEKIIRYSHTNLFGPIYSLEIKLREEGNPIQICPYYVVNSITGEMEVEIEDATNEKKKRKCKVQISESNLKLFKSLTMEQHCHFLNYLLACSEKIPIYDYQYQFMSREKDTNRIRSLEELLEDRVKLMIDGADGSSHPVKDVSVVLNGGDLDALGEKICLLIKRLKKTNILKSLSIHPRIVEIEEILSCVKDKSFTPREIYFEYTVRDIKHQDKLLDCIQCHLFTDNKAYFKEGRRWFRNEGDFLRQIRWKVQYLMDELLIPDDDENFLPLPCLENLEKRAKNEDTQEKEIMDILQRTNVKSACCKFLKLIAADDSKREDVNQVVERLVDGIKWVPPFFDQKDTERAIMKLDQKSRTKLEDAFGKEEFNLFQKFFTAIKKEEDYNRMYIDLQNLCPSLDYIVGDQIEIRNIELFDILKIPKGKSRGEVHLYHVKRHFDVSSVRAVVSQIKNSAEFLQRSLCEDTSQLKKYYNLLIQSNKTSKEKSSSTDTFRGRVAKSVHKLIPTAEKFIEMFKNNTLVFVYAFTDHLLSRTKYCNKISELGCMANRKLEIMNGKNGESSTEKEDNFVFKEEEKKRLLNCGYLVKSDGTLSINELAFRDEKKRTEEHFVSVLRNHGLTNESRMKRIFKLFVDRLCPLSLDSTGSCMDLLKLKAVFTHDYPKFRLKICQIKRPWYWADDSGKNSSEGKDSHSKKETTDDDKGGSDDDKDGLEDDKGGSDDDKDGSDGETDGSDKDSDGSDDDKGGSDDDRDGSADDKDGSDDSTGGSDDDENSLDDEKGGSDDDKDGSDNDKSGSDDNKGGSDNDKDGLEDDKGGPDEDKNGSDDETDGLDEDSDGSDDNKVGSDEDSVGSDDNKGGSDDDSNGSDDDKDGSDDDTDGSDEDSDGSDDHKGGSYDDKDASDDGKGCSDDDKGGSDNDKDGSDEDSDKILKVTKDTDMSVKSSSTLDKSYRLKKTKDRIRKHKKKQFPDKEKADENIAHSLEGSHDLAEKHSKTGRSVESKPSKKRKISTDNTKVSLGQTTASKPYKYQKVTSKKIRMDTGIAIADSSCAGTPFKSQERKHQMQGLKQKLTPNGNRTSSKDNDDPEENHKSRKEREKIAEKHSKTGRSVESKPSKKRKISTDNTKVSLGQTTASKLYKYQKATSKKIRMDTGIAIADSSCAGTPFKSQERKHQMQGLKQKLTPNGNRTSSKDNDDPEENHKSRKEREKIAEKHSKTGRSVESKPSKKRKISTDNTKVSLGQTTASKLYKYQKATSKKIRMDTGIAIADSSCAGTPFKSQERKHQMQGLKQKLTPNGNRTSSKDNDDPEENHKSRKEREKIAEKHSKTGRSAEKHSKTGGSVESKPSKKRKISTANTKVSLGQTTASKPYKYHKGNSKKIRKDTGIAIADSSCAGTPFKSQEKKHQMQGLKQKLTPNGNRTSSKDNDDPEENLKSRKEREKISKEFSAFPKFLISGKDHKSNTKKNKMDKSKANIKSTSVKGSHVIKGRKEGTRKQKQIHIKKKRSDDSDDDKDGSDDDSDDSDYDKGDSDDDIGQSEDDKDDSNDDRDSSYDDKDGSDEDKGG